MAGTKIVMIMNRMPQNNIHGFQGRASLSLSNFWNMNSNGRSKRKFRVNQKVKQIAPQTIIEYEESMDHEDVTSTKLTALVAVRKNKNKGSVNEVVQNIFMPQNHNKGCVVLQLVSTKLDPSKTFSHSFFFWLCNLDT